MGGQIGYIVKRVAALVVAAVIVLAALDGGSVVLTQMQLPDHVKVAGYAAAEVSGPGPTNRQTAVAAWKAAEAAAEKKGFTVRSTDFTIYPDGRVKLTGTRQAPTFLLHRLQGLHFLQVLVQATDTETVKALPYTSSPQLLRRTR